MREIIKNFLFLIIGIILLPFAICTWLCSFPFIIYRRLIGFFEVRGIEYNDWWFANKLLDKLVNYLMGMLL